MSSSESTTDAPQGVPALSHLDEKGRAGMVDVATKPDSVRTASARALIRISAEADRLLLSGALKKGPPLEVVRVASIQGAKAAAQLIPLCHPVRLSQIEAQVARGGESVWSVIVTVKAVDRTGVEMEAMTGAAIGALTFYDMIKAVDRSAVIETVVLLHKSGGRSGPWQREPDPR